MKIIEIVFPFLTGLCTEPVINSQILVKNDFKKITDRKSDNRIKVQNLKLKYQKLIFKILLYQSLSIKFQSSIKS